MLRYSVKPNVDYELNSFPIRELFVSPDLSYISGVTGINVGLVNGEKILIKSPYLIGNEIDTINTQTVKRQGKVEVEIEIPVKKIEYTLNFPIHSDMGGESYILAFNKKVPVTSDGDYVLSSITQNYVEYKGDICYFFDGDGSTKGYLIDHKFYTADTSTTSVTITSYTYIEDGELVIGDYTYYADFSNDGNEPILRLSKRHNPIQPDDLLGLIEGYECKFKSIKEYEPSDWVRVCKFYIEKHENPTFEVEDALYGGYRHYVTFIDENYYLRDIYQYDDEQDETVYKGYGITLDGEFCEAFPNYESELKNKYHDLPFNGGYVYIEESDEYLEIYDSLVNPVNGGCFVFLVGADEYSDVVPGNFIIAESNSSIEVKKLVDTDDNGNRYITFCGNKYFVESNLCDKVTISDNDYVLTYLNEDLTSADTIINGEVMYFDVKTEEWEDGKMHPVKAVLSNKIYYKESEGDNGIKVDYGVKDIDKDGYDITEYSGVTINDRKYSVIDYGADTDSDEFYIVSIDEKIKITLEVTEINGSSTYIAYPVIDNDTIDEITENELQREYCNMIVNNWKSFSFAVRKDTFGDKPITVENGLMDSMTATLPYSISNAHLLEKEIELFRMQNYLSFKFPLSNRTANNLRREGIIKDDFVDYIRSESVNTIVDMEKDVYYPVWKNGNEFKPIQQIRFNLHFRTRNFENWKIYEDDREFKDVPTPSYQKSNWFVTDLDYYKNDCGVGAIDKNEIAKKLHNASDLLGFMNFTTDEIKNQATKIGKSFLRLSFYSTNDPKTQVLLATSTIFLDENMAYKKYINSKRNSDLIYADVKVLQESIYSSFTQYITAVTSISQVSANTVSDSSEVYFDKYFNDESRLSSRLIVNDKYNTDTSSEGYYIYMFKDYSMKMREATIYMKVDFNHAGIGKTMAFMLPRINMVNPPTNREEDVEAAKLDVDGSSATPFSLYYKSDIEKLKNGFKLTDIYKQTHIPIKVIYDDKTNKYVYYLPDALRENTELGVDNEIMEFNLFEVKFANESIVENVA